MCVQFRLVMVTRRLGFASLVGRIGGNMCFWLGESNLSVFQAWPPFQFDQKIDRSDIEPY